MRMRMNESYHESSNKLIHLKTIKPFFVFFTSCIGRN